MRVHNFSAGPAAIATPVLERAQAELLNYAGVGASVMEISHRGAPFMALAEQIEANLRKLASIPDDYAVLFLQGGATGQFSNIPQNFLDGGAADYLVTGHWSKKAFEVASRYPAAGSVHCIANTASTQYRSMVSEFTETSGSRYLHLASNETIHGVQFKQWPKSVAPLVIDMSSDILSKPIDFTNVGMIYAGAQKNIGPSGITLVVVRRDLLGRCQDSWPDIFNYQCQLDKDSMLNTPPTFAWYLAGLSFEWLLDQGGLDAIAAINTRKAAMLYDYIDQSSLYDNAIDRDCRSAMNVPFTLADDALTTAFLDAAAKEGMLGLKGHKALGGCRASIYNAISEAAVVDLVSLMQEFERTR